MGWKISYNFWSMATSLVWSGIVALFRFPEGIRRVIYTTNAIEAINRQIRKIIKNKGVFPDYKSIQKIIFLALTNAQKKWTIPIRDWLLALNEFAILCGTDEERFANIDEKWSNNDIILTQSFWQTLSNFCISTELYQLFVLFLIKNYFIIYFLKYVV